MRIILSILCFLILCEIHCQSSVCQAKIDSAKHLFQNESSLDQKEFDELDYQPIIDILNEALLLEPDNPEARYYLGYAYSRINSRDARTMEVMNLELVLKSSEQFEKIIKLSPKYQGEIISLDPYTKISSEWGSMAMTYLYSQKKDSAIWAFKEGKRRGGFGNYMLETNRKVLESCENNAILISSGDIYTIPLWYLQIVEGYRTDVSVVDINLLNTIWYYDYLLKNNFVEFDLPDRMSDSINYLEWTDSTISINDFTWIIKPVYNDKYILRSHRLFLSILQKNKFQREIYFTIGFNEEFRLGLKDYLISYVSVDKLIPGTLGRLNHANYCHRLETALQPSKYLNMNSPDELLLCNILRFNALNYTEELINEGEKAKAREVMTLLDKYVGENNIPYQSENGLKYLEYLRNQLR